MLKAVIEENFVTNLKAGIIDNYVNLERESVDLVLPKVKNKWSLHKFENRLSDVTRKFASCIIDKSSISLKREAKKKFIQMKT